MNPILSNYTASITELKASPSKLLQQSQGSTVAILNHNTTSAYLVPPSVYENLLNIADDYLLSKQINDRLTDNTELIKVSIEDL